MGLHTFHLRLTKLGADFIIVGTAAVQNTEFLENLSNEIGREKIIVSLDYKNKKVLTHGWDKSSEFSPIEIGKKIEKRLSSYIKEIVKVI